jgi:predicted MPP superfamily phosphohydrolase
MSQQGAVPKRRVTRRQFLVGVGVTGLSLAGYAKLIEPAWLDLARRDMKLSSRPDQKPVRLLHLSDLHASDVVALDFISRAITLGLEFKPDLIFVTGDFVTSRYDQFEAYARVLRRLPAAAPTFACLGNHDGGAWVRWRGGYHDTDIVGNFVQASGIELMHNRSKTLEINNWKLHVVGVGDLWAHECEPAKAFASTPADATTLLLSHNPDSKERLRPFPWHAVFCGHTHGGQFRMPVIGTPFAPVKDKRFIAGLYQWEDRWLHISKGIGNVHGLRFNCRPEVSLITLV